MTNEEATKQATKIEIPYPEGEPLQLRISVGGCRLRVSPTKGAAAGPWVSGSYSDPSGGLAVKIVDDGSGQVRITQQAGISAVKAPFAGMPELDLEISGARPFALMVETGASDGVLDLGGLPLTRLIVKNGAGRCEFDFSAPNPAEMEKLDIDAGAVTLVMRNLANANFSSMSMNGGAATYDFDYSGELRRDAAVKLSAGASTIKLKVPGETAATITPGSVLGSLDIGDGFFKKEGAFWTEAALAGKKPVLAINASVTLGLLGIEVT